MTTELFKNYKIKTTNWKIFFLPTARALFLTIVLGFFMSVLYYEPVYSWENRQVYEGEWKTVSLWESWDWQRSILGIVIFFEGPVFFVMIV